MNPSGPGPRDILDALTAPRLEILESVISHKYPVSVPVLAREHRDGYTVNGVRQIILKLDTAGLLVREDRHGKSWMTEEYATTSARVRYSADPDALTYAAAWLARLAIRAQR